MSARRSATGSALSGDELLSAASHAVREPLLAILGFADLLCRRRDEAFQEEALAHIARGSRQLSLAVECLLALFALELSGRRRQSEHVRLQPLLEGAAEAARRLVPGMPIECRCEPELSVHADRNTVSQLLRVLATWAAVNARGDGPTIVARSEGDAATIAVTAPELSSGEDEETLVFHAVRRLALEQRGHARREPRGAAGATITVALPRAEAPAANGARVRVLLVDDDEMIRSLLRVTLPPETYTVAEAADGEAALAACADAVPDLVLLDWGLPGPSGAEVLARLRELSPTPCVIVVTATAEERDYDRAVALGVDAFLTKPFSPSELLDAIERLLGRR